MIILDTNVVSEIMKTVPYQVVFDWVAAQDRALVFITAITEAEVRLGIALLPEGRRKRDLLKGATMMFRTKLVGSVLAFDHDAAAAYATIAAARRQSGRPISQSDAQIAGIVRSRGATLATRNVRDFTGCGFPVVDPWSTTA